MFYKQENKVILAGDIGGTKVNLALCQFSLQSGLYEVKVQYQKRYASHHFQSLSAIIKNYFEDLKKENSTIVEPVDIYAASFGVPGPVLDGRCQTTNLP